MDFKKDFNIKPKLVQPNGNVLFTNGTTDVIPNQQACEAYGYTYDVKTGTCLSFVRSEELDKRFNNFSNKSQGDQNLFNEGTVNTFINGQRNTTLGQNINCFINGEKNKTEDLVNNAVVIGTYGKALRQGEFVLGGGGNKTLETFAPQATKIIMSGNTTDNTATFLNVLGINDAYITTVANSLIGFEAFVTRVEAGGSSGTVGNFSYRHIKGHVVCDNSNAHNIVTFNSRVLAKDGVNGTCTMQSQSSGNLALQVTDRNNVTNYWSAVIYLHEMHTNLTIS